MGPLAKDVIQRLLIKDPKKRLGSGPDGAENVKKHPFYQVDLIASLVSSTIFRKTKWQSSLLIYIMVLRRVNKVSENSVLCKLCY